MNIDCKIRMKREITMTIETIMHGNVRSQLTSNRIYECVDNSKMHVFTSEQKTIVYACVHTLKSANLHAIAQLATEKNLKSKTPIEASCKFHLAELVKMNLIRVK